MNYLLIILINCEANGVEHILRIIPAVIVGIFVVQSKLSRVHLIPIQEVDRLSNTPIKTN